MKATTIIFTSVLLVGCQALQQEARAPKQHVQSLFSASTGKAGKEKNPRVNSGQWLNGDGNLSHQRNLWKFIGDELNMDIPDNRWVREQKKHYLSRKSYLHDVALRAEPYMYWIVEQIKQRDMPMELVLIPIVESAFDPRSISPAKAAGIWQIVPQTGRNYGLKQNQWYDGRKDVAASTTAALDILQHLNRMFDGDWLLTIAAYNSGEGRVMQAIKANKAKGLSTNFWTLSLPRETMLYVPRMLALSEIIRNNQRYGVRLPHTNVERALARIEVGQQIKLSQAADMAGISLAKLKSFNSGYIRNVTAPNGPHYIMLPTTHASQFKNSLAENRIKIKLTAEERQLARSSSFDNHATQPYKVRSGDTLYSIAKRLNVTQAELKNWNSLSATKQLKVGQMLQVVKNNSRHIRASSSITYQVRKGDSLYSVAKRHGVEIHDVMRWNNVITKTNFLQPGDTLTLFVVKKELPGS